MYLNETIRRLRRKRDWTQQNLAEELDVDISTIIRWEKNASSINQNRLEKIASVFDLSVAQLLEYEEDDVGISVVLEPDGPSLIRTGSNLKVLIELDGTEDQLKFWIEKLTNINRAIAITN